MADLPTLQDTSKAPLPPLLSLSTEVKLHIISYLLDIEDFEDYQPSLIILRRTHRTFHAIIPSAPYGPPVPNDLMLRYDREKRLLSAERQHPYLFPPNTFPCYRCQLVLDSSAFGDFNLLYAELGPDDLEVLTHQRILPLGAVHAGARKCNQCWDVDRRSPAGKQSSGVSSNAEAEGHQHRC